MKGLVLSCLMKKSISHAGNISYYLGVEIISKKPWLKLSEEEISWDSIPPEPVSRSFPYF